jgi:hypothetical protein
LTMTQTSGHWDSMAAAFSFTGASNAIPDLILQPLSPPFNQRAL